MDQFNNSLPSESVDASTARRASECGPRKLQRSGIDARTILEMIEPPSRLVNPEERAMQLATAVARLVGGERCVIVLVEEADAARPVLRPLSRSFAETEPPPIPLSKMEAEAARDAIASGRCVLAGGAPRRASRTPTPVENERPSATTIIACPIRIDGSIVGAICIIGREAIRRIRPDDLAAVDIAGCLVGHALQSSRLQNLLKSQFAQLAMSREGASPDHALALSNAHPAQLCRILAKSFYREMIKLGFESAQIISAASEIISQLSGSLKKHKDRWQRNEALRRSPAAGLQ